MALHVKTKVTVKPEGKVSKLKQIPFFKSHFRENKVKFCQGPFQMSFSLTPKTLTIQGNSDL